MKKFFVMVLSVTLSMVLLTPAAFAWESHPVDMDQVGVDVGVSSWAAEGMKAAAEAGIVPALTGNPGFQDPITRQQFAELIVSMTEKATGKTIAAAPDTTFTDTKEPAILKAYAAGIVSGVGNNKFAPDQATNREQIASMIYRAITYIEKEAGKEVTTKNTDLSKFTDKASVSGWAAEGVGVLANNDIMKGTSDTTLSPKESCTVEQCVLLVHRVYLQVQG